MRVLVTGANGLLGSRLVALLGARGHSVSALGRGARRGDGPEAYTSVDLTEESAVSAALTAARPEVVVNAGSMTDVDRCESAALEAFRVNGVAPGTIARLTRALGAHLVHVSTDYVFDGEAGPYTEDAVPNPRGVYALTKHIGEQAVRALSDSWAIARTAVVYGWPPAGRPNFGAWLIQELRSGRPVRLFRDQYISPSLAESVAEQVAEVAERRLSGVWNVCGADVVNRVQFGEALCAEFGLSTETIVPTLLAEAKLKSPRPVRSGLRSDKAAAQLTARPLGLAASLARFHQTVRAAEGAKT
jgi:dTDP-4-dehydrorhamnose reductase